MNTLATVVNLIGRAWAVSAEGERREIKVGDRLRGDEMLITEPGARVDLAFDNNQILSFLGEQQQTIGEAAEAAQAALPLAALRPVAEGRGQPDAQPQPADDVPEGHNFVQLVRINEILEADGITPLTVARIQEMLRPLGMSLPERVYELDEWREHRGGDERHETGPAARKPGLSIELQGAGPDGVYNEEEIGPDGTVPAEVTLDDQVREGDQLVIKDGKGNILLHRPVTAEDLRDGVTIEVPVEPGDRNVTVEATVTTPQGFTGTDRDGKLVDNDVPGVSVELQGAGPDGVYNKEEIGPGGTVPAQVTLDDKVEIGDILKVTDNDGNVLLERPVTQEDLDNGVIVQVPVAPGDTEVPVTAMVTDPAGNSSSDSDNKPVDNTAPTVTVELQGAGPDGVYNKAEIGPDGTVPALVTPGPTVEVGDTLVVTDKDGNILLERPVTQDDLDNGVIVQVPVSPGDTEVPVTTTITDPAGNSGTDTDSKPVDNLPPVATLILDQNDMDADQISLDISTYFNDAIGGKSLTYSAAGLPTGLNIDPVTGVISGTIDHSASQQDSDGDGQADGLYGVTITVTDEAGNSTDATFIWTVGNPPPVAENDNNTTLEDTPLHIAAANGVLANDSDPDGDEQLTVIEFTVDGQAYNAGDTASIPGVGELTLNENGSYSFVPEPNWNGNVPTVTYTVSDGEGGTDTAELDITVTPVLDITLTASPQVTEGDKITVTASVETPVAGEPLHIILNNGQTITIPVGATSASIEVDSRPDDAYEQGTTTETFEVVNAVGGNEHINDSSLGSSATTEIIDDSDVTTVSVTTTDVTEDDAEVTFVFQLSNPPQTGETVTLTVEVAGTDHTVTIDGTGRGELSVSARSSDVYVDPDTLTATVTDISGGNFEATDLTGASATAQITDTIDTVTAYLSVDRTSTEEGTGNLVYTVELRDANGDPVTAQNDVTVSTTLGAVIIAAGDSSGTLNVPVQNDDIYRDGETVNNVITDISEANAGDPGSFEQLGYDNTPVSTTVDDTIDTVTVVLTVDRDTTTEGTGDLIYTVELHDADGNPVTANNDILVVTAQGNITIPANSSSATLNVPVQGDDVYLDGETVSNAITNVVESNGGAAGSLEALTFDGTSVSTVINDTPDTVTAYLSVDRTSTEEGTGDLVYTVELRDANGDPVTAQNDVTVSTTLGTVTIAANDSSGILSVPVQGDDVYLDGETVDNVITGISEVNAGQPGSFEQLGYDNTPVSTTVDDTIDTVTAYLSMDRPSTEEGTGDLVYTVELRDANGDPVTAQNDVTVSTTLGPVTIAANDSSGILSVPVQGDDVYLDGETVDNVITDISEANAGDPGSFEDLDYDDTVVTTVVSDTIDTTSISLTAGPDLTEAGGTLTYTVTLGADVRPDDDPVEVTFTDLNGDEQTITINSGSTGTVDVIIPDSLFEDPYLEAPEDLLVATDVVVSGGADFEQLGTPSVGTIELTDSIDTTTLTLNDVTVEEGSGMASITASLDHAPQSTLVVTLNNGAVLIFEPTYVPGDLVTSTPFPINNGEDVYNDESQFDLSVANTSGGNFEYLDTSDTATVTVTDTIDITSISLTAGPDLTEAGGDLTYTVTLGSPVRAGDAPVTVEFVDLNGDTQTITINSGATGSVTVSIPSSLYEDVYVEDPVNLPVATDVVVSGGDSFEGLGVPSVGTVQLVDTIDTTSISLTAGPDLTEAGGTLTYTVTLGADVRPGDDPVSVTFTDLNGDEQTITISSGSTGTVDVTIPDTLFEDPYLEAPEDLLVATDVVVSGGADFEQLGTPSVGTIELTDSIDDTTATLTVSGSGDEDNGSITYTVTLDNEPQAAQDFSVTLSNGQTVIITVAAGASTGSITFGWGTGAVAGTQPLTGYPDGDVYIEPDFELEVTDFVAVGNGGNFEHLVTEDDTTAITISDTPTPVTVTLSDIVGQEGELHTITATVDHPVTGTDLVITLSNGETITIEVGQTVGTSDPFEIQSDDVYVDGENYEVSITNTDGGNFEALVTTATSSVTVTDTIDTTSISLTAGPDLTEAGGTLTYTVTLGADVRPGDDPVSVTFTDLNGDEQTITISSGSTGTVDVTIPDTLFEDPYLEAPEDLLVATDVVVSGGADFEQLGTPSVGTIELTDSIDDTTATLKVSRSGDEDNGSITYTVTLDNEPQAAQDFSVTLSNGQTVIITVAAGASTGSITFGWGTDAVAGTQPLTGYPDGDVYIEPDFELEVTDFVAVGNGGNFENLVTENETTAITISDTPTPVTVTLSDIVGQEGELHTITATVDQPVTKTDLVIALSNGETITIAVGQTTGTSDSFEIQCDDVYVDGESYDVSITGTNGGNFEELVTTDTSSVTVTDTNDPVYARITVDHEAVLEDGELTYTVSLVDGSGNPVTVEANASVTVQLVWSGAAATAADLADFAGLPSSVTIGVGHSESTFTVTTLMDAINEYSEPLNVTITGVDDTAGATKLFEELRVSTSEGSVSSDILDAPTIGGSVTVYEKGLNDASDDSESAEGVIRITAPSGLDSIVVVGQSISLADLQALGASPRIITIAGHGTLTLTGFAPTETVNGKDAAWEISYTYTLTAEQTHTEQGIDDLLRAFDLEVVAGNPLGGTTSVDGMLGVTVIDDVPTVTLTGYSPDVLQVEESSLVTGTPSATVNFSGAFATDYGADGAATIDALVYSFTVNTAVSTGLLDTGTGDPISLHVNDSGDVEGRVGNSEEVAFVITVDDSGNVTLTQSRPLSHPVDTNPNDILTLANGALSLQAEATDGDGDKTSASINIGDRFSFKDDGPSLTGTTLTVELDEAHLATGSDPDASKTTSNVILLNIVSFGGDGAGNVQFTDATKAGLEAMGLTARGDDLVYTISSDGHTLIAYRDSEGTGNEVFTVVIDDPTGTPGYQFTLNGAFDHINEFDDMVSALRLPFNGVRVTDADGDSVTTEFSVIVKDDAPDEEELKLVTVEEDSTDDAVTYPDNTFNTNADALGGIDGNTTIGNGSGDTVAPKYGTATVNDDGTITYVPDANYSGKDTFTYTTVTDNETKTFTVEVTVTPAADAPNLPHEDSTDPNVSAIKIVPPEDTAVALGLKTPVITDAVDENSAVTAGDHPERLGAINLTVNPSGTPEATPELAYISGGAGPEQTLTPNSSGGYTIIIVNGGDINTSLHHGDLKTGETNVNYLTRAEYESIQAVPAEDRHENFEVVVRVSSYEVDDSGVPLPDSAVVGSNGVESTQTITVDVLAVTDEVVLKVHDKPEQSDVVFEVSDDNKTVDITLNEDTSFNLTAILNPDAFKDTDGSETRYLGFDGLPDGTIVTVGSTAYTIGSSGIPTQVVDGRSVPVIEMPGTQTALPVVSIQPPKDFSGDLTGIKVILAARDSDSDNPTHSPDVEWDEITLNLYVNPVAGDVNASSSHIIEEDTPVAFLSGIRVTDDSHDDTGGEVITRVEFTLPTGGWTLTSQPASTGAWSISGSGSEPYIITFNDDPADGDVLTQEQREEVLDQFKVTPPAHSSLDAAGWEIKVTTVDSQTVDGAPVPSDPVETPHTVTITVTPVGERTDSDTDGANGEDVTINPDHVYSTTGMEDQPFSLGTDTGFLLSAGWSNEDGTWVSDGVGNWTQDTSAARNEDTFALLTPYETGNDAQSGAVVGDALVGSTFSYSDGTTTHTLTFTGEPVAIPMQYLDSVVFQGPTDWFGVVKIEVNARTVDRDEDDDGTTDIQDSGQAWLTNLIIHPSADRVTLKVDANPSTTEDTDVTLNLRPSTSSNRTDVDTSFDVAIAGIPEGARITYGGVTYTTDSSLPVHDPADHSRPTGIYQADGSYVLVIRDFDEDKQPVLTPPTSSNETIQLSVTADAVDTLTYTDASGNEQTLVSRGSEAMPPLTHTLPIEVEVLGVPNTPEMTVVAKEYIEDGGDQSGGQLEVNLKNLITHLDSGEPGVNAAGPDGSETITLRISNLAEGFELIGAGAVISGEGDTRVWVVTKADLDSGNIKILVPQHWSGTLKFTAQPVVTENDNKAEKFFNERNVEFTVKPVVEATLSISSSLMEDTVGELELAPVGADADEYISTVRIAEGDLSSAGVTLYADAAGTVPLVVSDGYYTISNAQTSGAPSVYVKGPANFSGSITLDIQYQVTDPSTDGSLLADTSAGWQSVAHTLNFVPYTDQIGMKLMGAAGEDVVTGTDGVITKTGAGSVDITLDISQLADSKAGNAADADGSERLTHILISGMPGGVSVQGATQVGGGWLLPTGDNWDGSANLEQTLTLLIGPYATDFESEITITAYSRDQGAVGQTPANNQELAEITWTLRYEDGEGDAIDLPEVSLTPTEIEQTEDQSFALSAVVEGGVTGGQNTGAPYELAVTVRTSPGDGVEVAGLTPTLVIENGEEVLLWTKTTTVGTGIDPADALKDLLDSMTVNAPDDANRNNLDGPLVLDITASVQTQGISREERADIEVDIAPVTDALSIGVSTGGVGEGEDIPLVITLPGNTVDGDLDGSGAAKWVIDNNLVYIHIAEGDLAGQLTDAEGTPLLEFDDTAPAGTPAGGKLYAVSAEELAGLKFVPDAGLPHQTGSLAVTVVVEHTENAGSSRVSMGTGALTIHQSNSGYEADITASGTEHSASADPSKAIALQFTGASLRDTAETIDSAFISGLPDGFTVYYQNGSGDSVLANNAGDGTWVLPVSGGALPAGIAILPPKHWSGTLEDIKLTVRSGHAGLAPSPSEILFDLQVAPQADGLTLNPTLSFGVAGDRIALNLNVHMKDPRPAAGAGDDAHTERTTLELRDFPDAQKVLFYTGAADLIADGRATYESGKWTITGLTQEELDNLQFMHGSTTGSPEIIINAWTYEVDADGNQVGDLSAPATGAMEINVDATLPTAGADLFLWEGSPIDGLGGSDTVQLRFGDNLGSGAFSQLSNIEVIDMSGVASGVNTIAALSVEDVFNMTDDNNLLKLLGDAEDSVTLGAGWGTGEVNGDLTIYTATHGGTEVKVEVQTTLIE